MPLATLHLAPAGVRAEVFVAAVARRLGATVEGPSSERRAVLDTFDWRVHRNGLALEHVTLDGGAPRLVLRPRGDGRSVTTAPIGPVAPTMIAELPAGRLRDRLVPVLDVRALVAAVTFDVVVRVVVVRDGDDDKVVARLAVDDLGDGHVIVRSLPVRGYDGAARRAVAALVDAGCQATNTDAATLALAVRGRRAGDRGGKLALRLDPEGPSAGGWVVALTALLEEIEANVPGTLADTDTEFLHDLRVAVRRSRSALRHAKGVLPRELLECFRPELKWLQEITGDARDLDVYVLAADDDLADLDAASRTALEPFRAFLGAQRVEAHARLDDDLHSAAFAAVLDDWRATLATLADTLDDDEAGEWGDWPGEAGRRLADAAAQRVKAQHRKLLRAGCRIDADSPATDLHELRKDGKELRYLLELFGALLNRERVGPFVKTLKGLQDVLGEFQDTEVQVHALRRWADELASAGGVGTATLLAMGELIERLQGRQAVARAAFTERFTRFAAAGRP